MTGWSYTFPAGTFPFGQTDLGRDADSARGKVLLCPPNVAGSAQNTNFLRDTGLPGPEPKFYFAPVQIRKRNAIRATFVFSGQMLFGGDTMSRGYMAREFSAEALRGGFHG